VFKRSTTQISSLPRPRARERKIRDNFRSYIRSLLYLDLSVFKRTTLQTSAPTLAAIRKILLVVSLILSLRLFVYASLIYEPLANDFAELNSVPSCFASLCLVIIKLTQTQASYFFVFLLFFLIKL
jgi:hypothetical protein